MYVELDGNEMRSLERDYTTSSLMRRRRMLRRLREYSGARSRLGAAVGKIESARRW